MFCRSCGKELGTEAKFCPFCGSAQHDSENSVSEARSSNESDKSRLAACLLAFFVGGLGIHRFYAGKIGSGICQILLTCCFGIGCIWAFIDFILIVCGSFTDSEGKIISNWGV